MGKPFVEKNHRLLPLSGEVSCACDSHLNCHITFSLTSPSSSHFALSIFRLKKIVTIYQYNTI